MFQTHSFNVFFFYIICAVFELAAIVSGEEGLFPCRVRPIPERKRAGCGAAAEGPPSHQRSKIAQKITSSFCIEFL